MINIENAYKEFKKYVSNYDPENHRVKLKIDHIKRVAKNCKKIAEKLNLSKEEVLLAELIGIFHDLGRFEQVKIANTFSDKDSGINHAQMSVKVLFEDNLIRNYIQDTIYDNIIKLAVLNHNKIEIEDGLTEKELLFAKIIRDADKIDIFYITTFYEFKPLFWYNSFDQEEINPFILKQIENHELIDYKSIKNNADLIPIFYAYVFNLYFQSSLKFIAKEKYLDKFTERIKENFTNKKVHEQTDYILKVCHEFFKQKGIA